MTFAPLFGMNKTPFQAGDVPSVLLIPTYEENEDCGVLCYFGNAFKLPLEFFYIFIKKSLSTIYVVIQTSLTTIYVVIKTFLTTMFSWTFKIAILPALFVLWVLKCLWGICKWTFTDDTEKA